MIISIFMRMADERHGQKSLPLNFLYRQTVVR